MNNFTTRAQRVLLLARRESGNYVGAEHLLLGLVKLDQGVGCSVLRKTLEGVFEEGQDVLESIRTMIRKYVEIGDPTHKLIGNIPYTPQLERILALASGEAQTLNHQYVGTEHLLLGMISEGDSLPAVILEELGLSLEIIRESVMKELDLN